MPILFDNAGPTDEDSFQQRDLDLEEWLSEPAEEALYHALQRLNTDLIQLRELGPTDACADVYYSPQQLPELMRDIQFVISRGPGRTEVSTQHLKEELSRLLVLLEQALNAESHVLAHME